jgi:hypothetical protein
MPIREDLAWAGGLFEGEGCFTFRRTDGRAGVATISMTDEDTLRRFHDVVGFGVLHQLTRSPSHKPLWRWDARSFEHIQCLVAFLWPWLGSRRRKRAREVLLTLQTTTLSPTDAYRRFHLAGIEATRRRNSERALRFALTSEAEALLALEA